MVHFTLEEELAGKKTKYEEMIDRKYERIEQIKKMLKENPDITRSELAKAIGVLPRTISRYLAEIRKKVEYKPKDDKLHEEKINRLSRLKILIKDHPEYSRVKLAKVLGVSLRTLIGYFKELES